MTATVRLLVVALLLVGGCDGGEPSAAGSASTAGTAGTAGASGSSATASSGMPTGPVPRILTPADDGGAFTMAVGATATLRVPNPAAPDPVVDGGALLVVPVVNVTASGVREWELRAVAPGTATLTGSDPDYRFTVTVR